MIAAAAKGLATMGIFKRNKNSGNNERDNHMTPVFDASSAGADNSDTAAPGFELIAVITAAVQAFLETGKQNKLIVRSFKRISSDNSLWNEASRYEQLGGKL